MYTFTVDNLSAGTVTDIELGPETVVSSIPVACERDEGDVVDGECISELRAVTVVVAIEPAQEAWASPPPTAEVIRVALRDAAMHVERPRITGIGLAHGPGDVADNVDRHLAETSFGSE